MTSDTPLELTVCSVARTPADPVARLLDALAHQTAPNGSYDAVLVDATSSGAFASLQPVAGVTVHVVRVDADTSHADALNAGWRAASGRAIGFVAVDFVPARAWVESMATALRRGRRLVTGSLQPNPDTIDRAGGMSHRLWASRRELPLVTSDQMACLRDDLDRVDGFDPSVPAEVCDVDLAARLVDDGVDRFRSRHAVAFHDVEEIDVPQMVAERGLVRAELDTLAEHPRARARLLVGGVFWHRRNVEALLAVAGAVAATRDRRALLLAAPWIHERTCLAPRTGGPRRKWLILPGVFAFDVYDAVTTTAARLRPMRPR